MPQGSLTRGVTPPFPVSDPLHDRTLALAGLFQAARLAQTLAREGRADEPAFAASLKSLFSFDAENVAEVYGESPVSSRGCN